MNVPDEIWTTRDGRKLLVGEMDEQHVRNALRMVLRNRRQLRERLGALNMRSLALILRPYLRKLDAAEEARIAEAEQRFHEDLYNEVFRDNFGDS